MRNLLSAGFARLWRSKAFYLSLGALFLLAVFIMLNFSRQAMADTSGYSFYLEHHYFDTAVYSGIFIAAFIGIFISVDYSDGTLRNKLIIGHTRTAVYLSHLIICAAASVIFTVTWVVGGMVGIPVLGLWAIPADQLFLVAVVSVLASISLSAIFLSVCILSANKAVTAVTCILLSLALIVIASFFGNNLAEPEMTHGMTITMENGLQVMDPTPNPNYVTEPLRTVYIAIINILPTGQQMLLANLKSGLNFAVYPLQIAGSLLLTVLCTGAGLFLFRRKDLK